MGDKPCEVDCVIFGALAQVHWQLPRSPLEKYMRGLSTLILWWVLGNFVEEKQANSQYSRIDSALVI